MAKSNNQKAKILFLEQMLRETGENHVVSMQEILEALAERGISAERKSIYDDLDALRTFGMDVRFHRGRPGGYYLAGQIVDETKAVQAAKPSAAGKKTVDPKPAVPAFQDMRRTGEKKQMVLFCEKSREKEIRDFFGTLAEITQEEPDLLVVEATLSTDPRFFGWITAMNGDVHLRKPKKLAQTYREYLKNLAREYKGIGKKEE